MELEREVEDDSSQKSRSRSDDEEDEEEEEEDAPLSTDSEPSSTRSANPLEVIDISKAEKL
jgi:hypothetical protein